MREELPSSASDLVKACKGLWDQIQQEKNQRASSHIVTQYVKIKEEKKVTQKIVVAPAGRTTELASGPADQSEH